MNLGASGTTAAARLAWAPMYEYRSLRSSTYDVDSLVDRLNGADGDGWEVVTVVNAGGDLVAILRRGNAPAAAAAVSAAPSAPSAAASSEESKAEATPPSAVKVAATDPAPAPKEEPAPEPTPEPVMAIAAAAPVEEPAGWAAAVETPRAEPAAREPEPQPAAVATRTQPEPAPAAQPEQQPVVTTPAGWYPDPSGRFELRYWNGTAWTEHVARGGQQYTDPPVA